MIFIPELCLRAEWPVSSLPAAVPGHVSRWALHREASEGSHGEVQEAAGRDNQLHQEEERGKEATLLQHVPRQDPKQRCCLSSDILLELTDSAVASWNPNLTSQEWFSYFCANKKAFSHNFFF